MLTIKILNKCTKNNIADYTYGIYINDDLITKGIYKGHDRADGWAKLVHDIAKLHLEDKEN